MRYTDEKLLHVEVDTKHCQLHPDEEEKFAKGLEPLRKVIGDFPVADLYVTIRRYPRSGDYHLKTSLLLSGQTLFTGERHEVMYTAFERCIRKLVHKVQAYKDRLASKPEMDKQRENTHQSILPGQTPDLDTIEQAVQSGDYPTFRRELLMYEEPVRKRVGRWVQRYPELDASIGKGWQLADLVEEVFLNAFENYGHRPVSVPMSTWLEHLIDPSLKESLRHPDEAHEAVAMMRTWTGR